MLLMFRQINGFPEVKNVQEETDSDHNQGIDAPDHHVIVPVVENENGSSNGKHKADNKDWGEHNVSVKGMEELIDVLIF